jgi:acyl phosphate:glycerol-3-phosphate acyltransferase
MLLAFLTIAAGYFIGAIPFGYLLARRRGVDIFQHGSGNIGATNIARVLGRRCGLLVFVLDFAKGAISVGLAMLVRQRWGSQEDLWQHGWVEVATGLAAFLGHLFPVYLCFQGGKGVATGAGVVAVLLPVPAGVGLAAWLVVVIAFRYVSLASVAAVVALWATYLLVAWPLQGVEPRTLFCLLAAFLIVVRHRGNLVRLLHGREPQLEDRPALFQLRKSLHVLALGLWFGSALFFTFIVGLTLFHTFEALGQEEQRPAWFPRVPAFAKSDAAIDGPKEQGARIAGYAVSPLFGRYFALQGICGLVALLTALAWVGGAARSVDRWRVYFLSAALLLVIIGWPLERQVSSLRLPRNRATDVYLCAPPEAADGARAEMRSARGDFGRWHTYSLLLNLSALVCVCAAMALAGNLPAGALSEKTIRPRQAPPDGAFDDTERMVQELHSERALPMAPPDHSPFAH